METDDSDVVEQEQRTTRRQYRATKTPEGGIRLKSPRLFEEKPETILNYMKPKLFRDGTQPET